MLKDLEKPQKIFFYILFGLTAVAIALGIFAVYGFINVAKPRTLGVSYATVLNSSSGEVPICEVNIFANKNNNGLELYEIKFNSYTDAEGSWVKGFGIQVPEEWGVGLYANEIKEWESAFHRRTYITGKTVIHGDYSYYQSDDFGESSYKLDISTMKDNLYIDIEGTFYQIVLNDYNYTAYKSKWNGSLTTYTESAKYTWYHLFKYIVSSTINSSNATGDATYYIDLL